MKYYGSLNNRLEEGLNYNSDRMIHVGDDVTMYHYTDRSCYYVSDVIDQTHIMLKPYHVVADKTKVGGMGHQNWVYIKEEDASPMDLILRKNGWYTVHEYNLESWENCKNNCRTMFVEGTPESQVEAMARFYTPLTDKEFAKMLSGKTVTKYKKLSNNISFGVRDYYYDWEF